MNILTSISSVVLVFIGSFHPLHVSVTEIEMDEKDKALEIMMRVFVDDVELTLRKTRNEPALDVMQLKNGLTIDQMMTDYLKDHFKISLDGKAQKIKYIGHEVEGEAFIFYSEVSGVKKWNTIQVQNNIIMETHEDQSNLVHVTVRGNVRSLRLTAETPTDKLVFDTK
jgi:hypothetical protein